LIQAADLFSQQTEDRDLHVVEAFDEIVHLLLPPHPHAVNAVQEREDPSSGWRRGGWVDWVRYRLVVLCELLTQAALCH
jgi:hypothetical protein